MEREDYQIFAVNRYLDEEWDPHGYRDFFECARYRDLAFSYIAICAALVVVATPTCPRKRKITNIS